MDGLCMYGSILLPTDGSDGASNATAHALDAADRYGATLHVLHVIDSSVYESYSGDEYVHEFEGLETGLTQSGEEALEDVAQRARDRGIAVETYLTRGEPHEEILRYATDNDIEVIVLGSRDRSGEYRRLLGSVTERVARMASQPVTIVKTSVE